ncbi:MULTISPECIES: aminopeptidase [unclassified Chelatococcus]|uniref:aminopeptidase n=1 Tax=unclassified Chelatococcus TaxID=2638111 RepID=UPI001BCBAB8D|nr:MULTISPECIES: aminopeptidase [unclassified Chelatococcus]MBS7699942.1 aminopeptidase [Chelatococcus sp. YT9]MBX3558633.1 aminopeptidase [Chelatococcus sp.]
MSVDNEADKVARLADIVVNTLLATRPSEKVLIVTDVAGMKENGDVVNAITELSRAIGAETLLIEMNDNPMAGGEYLPAAVQAMMPGQDIIISLTRTTSAPLPHHQVPIGLLRANKLRGVFMVKRSRRDLFHESVMEADYAAMAKVANFWQAAFQRGDTVRVTSAAGTDLTASIKGQPSHRSDFAHVPGKMSPCNWGEVYQGPVVGSTNGRFVCDGPVLGFDWPKEPVVVTIENGLATGVTGDPETSKALWKLITENENGANIAEIALGINAKANDHSCNTYKKGLGRLHIAVGNGLVYNQDVNSNIHIDLVMHKPTVEIDGKVIVRDGVSTQDERD